MDTHERPSQDAGKEGSGPSPESSPVVVGIGASAGGLAALKTFFDHVPEDSGLAFVVVVHLSPEHESHLVDVLQPHVKMPVVQVQETTPIEANRVYVIPPNANLSAVDTHLRRAPLEARRCERAPIDHFFRTLARTHDDHAIGVILTGTGSDGTLGIKEIKEKNGLVVVQSPGEAEFDGMVQSAIATGLVDLVLPLAEMPEALIRFARMEPRLAPPADGEGAEDLSRQHLQRMFAQLRSRTGRDFSHYKRSTILRRIARRMQFHYVEELPAYLDLLREQPEEVHALADDLLITVTHFFRDPEVFEVLEQDVIPRLFEGKGPDDQVRVWSVGCATGEEAYSLAILLLEEAARRAAPPRIQVFASDLHERSLEKAREGFYPGDIEADVSAERLQRFFQKENGGYRIRKDVREMVVFAPHNLLNDPPFSRLELLACRNVLIYLQRNVQKDVIGLFHYALKPEGFLVLGTSEHVDASELFRTEDKKRCIYRKRHVPMPELHLPVFPLTRARVPGEPGRPEPASEPVPYGALHQRMVEQIAPPSLLVSPDNRVVHLSEHAGRYLVPQGGAFTASVFRLVREELRIELRAALHAVREQGQAVRTKPISVRFNGNPNPVILHVRPALEPRQEGYALVIFDEWEATGPADAPPEEADASVPDVKTHARVRELEAELEQLRQRLQGIIEEYERGQEELKASNEELQSANEELRSTLEELETSREELQSMNEELQTVNQENRHKVEELAQLTGDLQNLMAATGIATLFLDRNLRILRFTPRVSELFNVRTTDRGRPLSDLTHRLGYDDLSRDARQVLKTLVPIDREVTDEAGRWYLTRVLPYRSTVDRIEGVVVTFVDITERKAAEEALHEARVYAESIVETLHEPLLVLTPDLRVKSANPAFYAHFEVRPEVTEGRLIYELGNGQWDIPELRTLLEDVLPDDEVFNDYVVRHDFADIGERVMLLNARRLDHVQLILLGIRDITERKRAEAALRQSEERFRRFGEASSDVLWIRSADTLQWEYLSPAFETIYGRERASVMQNDDLKHWVDLVIEEDREAVLAYIERVRQGESTSFEYRIRWPDGEVRWLRDTDFPIVDAEGRITRIGGIGQDVTEGRQAQERLQQMNETLEERVEERTRQVRELAARLTRAEQAEGRRISQILHDDLQQMLFGVRMRLFVLAQAIRETGDPEAVKAADEIEAWTERAIETTRRLSIDLSPPILKDEGLTDVLGWLRTQMEELHGLTVEIEAEDAFHLADEDLRVLLFQIVRELLFNVKKHAGVDQATITLREEEGHLVVEVADAGRGYDATATPKGKGFGLRHAQERLRLLGGRMEIESRPGEGTRVRVHAPATPEKPGETG